MDIKTYNCAACKSSIHIVKRNVWNDLSFCDHICMGQHYDKIIQNQETLLRRKDKFIQRICHTNSERLETIVDIALSGDGIINKRIKSFIDETRKWNSNIANKIAEESKEK